MLIVFSLKGPISSSQTRVTLLTIITDKSNITHHYHRQELHCSPRSQTRVTLLTIIKDKSNIFTGEVLYAENRNTGPPALTGIYQLCREMSFLSINKYCCFICQYQHLLYTSADFCLVLLISACPDTHSCSQLEDQSP